MFLFAMVPGLSHMYLGMMKKGIFLMSLFLMPIALIFLTRGGLEIISCILPVVWCYSFFDTFRYKNYSREERYHLDAEFYETLKIFWMEEAGPMFIRRRKLIGVCCIFLAVYTFIYNILGYFTNLFGRIFWSCYIILSKVPTLLVVVFLLKLGIDLLRAEDDDFVAYQMKKQKNKYQEKKEQEIKEQKTERKETEDISQQEMIKLEKMEDEIVKEEMQQEITPETHSVETQDTQQIDIPLEKGEKIVEPIFLEKRIEE